MAKKSMIAKAERKQRFEVRAYHRCTVCGRPRAYMRRFGLCRICFRERARAAGVERVVFDRAGFTYHGRIRSLAEGARESGLEF